MNKIDDEAHRLLETLDLIYEDGLFTGDYEDAIKHYQNIFALKLGKTKKEYEAGNATNAKMLADLLSYTSRLLIEMGRYSQDEKFLKDSLRFNEISSKIFNEVLGHKLAAFDKGEKIGIFVVGLELFGASINQAQISVSEWVGKSVPNVKKHYGERDDRLWWKNSDNWDEYGDIEIRQHFFVSEYQFELADLFLEFKDRSFPCDKERKTELQTYQAFEDMKSALIKYFKDPEHEYCIRNKPLIAMPDWDALEKTKQDMIASSKKN